MNNLRKINKIPKALISIALFFLILGLSYAYFTANITGSETTTTISVSSGTMYMTFDGGNNITINNIFPRSSAWAAKTFTVTGNNTTDSNMAYSLYLEVDENTFSDDALQYKLTSVNTDNNGTVVAGNTDLIPIKSGVSSTLLGYGTYSSPTNGDKVHTYTLDIYFTDNSENQNEDHGKSFGAHIEILEGIGATNELLTDAIFDAYGGASSITEAPVGTFDNINGETENVMYKMEDDYGMSYYLRGAKDYVNNNIIFAEHQWKIVRINGDGSIRLIYNGTCPNNSCTINSTGTATQIGTSAFNTNYNDNKYVGYMYGGAAGEASTSREQATTNETNSNIKTYLDTWYSTNILNTDYEDYISDTLFCNDRQLQSEIGGAATGTGFGTSTTRYAAYYRLTTNKNPNIKCGLQNDRFTASDITIGNGALTYPIGLLTPDETAIAGLKSGSNNSSNYLYTNQHWWTSGPGYWGGGDAHAWAVSSGGNPNYGFLVINSYGVRGALNLNSETQATGTGTTSDPFKVV